MMRAVFLEEGAETITLHFLAQLIGDQAQLWRESRGLSLEEIAERRGVEVERMIWIEARSGDAALLAADIAAIGVQDLGSQANRCVRRTRLDDGRPAQAGADFGC